MRAAGVNRAAACGVLATRTMNSPKPTHDRPLTDTDSSPIFSRRVPGGASSSTSIVISFQSTSIRPRHDSRPLTRAAFTVSDGTTIEYVSRARNADNDSPTTAMTARHHEPTAAQIAHRASKDNHQHDGRCGPVKPPADTPMQVQLHCFWLGAAGSSVGVHADHRSRDLTASSASGASQ